MSYRLAFFFSPQAHITLDDLAYHLMELGEKTFEVLDEHTWFHKRYQSSILWKHDIDANILSCVVSDGEAVRTCGSLVEWMLRNASGYLDNADRDLRGVSVFS